MGDTIEKLPIDDALDYSQKDVSNLVKFFNTTVKKQQPLQQQPPQQENNIYMFIGMMILLFFICSHPNGLGRFIPEQYRIYGTSIFFGIILFIYLYFNK